MKNEYKKNYGFIETTEAVLFFLQSNKDKFENPIEVFMLDQKTKEFKKLTTLKEVDPFTIIPLNYISDNFIYCTSLTLKQVCYVTSYI